MNLRTISKQEWFINTIQKAEKKKITFKNKKSIALKKKTNKQNKISRKISILQHIKTTKKKKEKTLC